IKCRVVVAHKTQRHANDIGFVPLVKHLERTRGISRIAVSAVPNELLIAALVPLGGVSHACKVAFGPVEPVLRTGTTTGSLGRRRSDPTGLSPARRGRTRHPPPEPRRSCHLCRGGPRSQDLPPP